MLGHCLLSRQTRLAVYGYWRIWRGRGAQSQKSKGCKQLLGIKVRMLLPLVVASGWWLLLGGGAPQLKAFDIDRQQAWVRMLLWLQTSLIRPGVLFVKQIDVHGTKATCAQGPCQRIKRMRWWLRPHILLRPWPWRKDSLEKSSISI